MGIDFDKRSIENARRRFGFNNLYTKTLEEFVSYAETNDLSFDVITFFEVLEHQGRPLEFINNVRKVLKADGYIAGSVPNRERLLQKQTDVCSWLIILLITSCGFRKKQ